MGCERYVLGSFALVGGDGDRLGAGGLAEGQVLDRVGSCSSDRVLEPLDGADLGGLEAGQLVRLGRVNGGSDTLARSQSLEHVGRETGALVVDIDALEGDRVAGYQKCQPQSAYMAAVLSLPASETIRSLVAWSLSTVLPLKTVMVSLPVLVTETWAIWLVAPTISTESGQAAMAAPARATTETTVAIMVKDLRRT